MYDLVRKEIVICASRVACVIVVGEKIVVQTVSL
jgi:hypothetical protein